MRGLFNCLLVSFGDIYNIGGFLILNTNIETE